VKSRRTLILVIAIAVGAFAGFALLNYVRGIEDDKYAGTETVDVLIATQDIPAGTPASEALQMTEQQRIPQEILPTTYLPPDAKEDVAGLITLNDIPAQQIIVQGFFVDPTVTQVSYQNSLPEGHVAMALSIPQVNAVGGWLQPGDKVNIMARHDNQACGAGQEEGDADDPAVPDPDATDVLIYCSYPNAARYVFQQVEILSVGDRQAVQPGEETTDTGLTRAGGTIIFQLTNEAAQILASVEEADLVLTLLPAEYEAYPLPRFDEEFLDGPTPAETATCLTPYGPEGFIDGDEAAPVNDEGEVAIEQFGCTELRGG